MEESPKANQENLTIEDLKKIEDIIQAKYEELSVQGDNFEGEDGEHKAVKRAIKELIQIELENFSTAEITDLFKSYIGEPVIQQEQVQPAAENSTDNSEVLQITKQLEKQLYEIKASLDNLTNAREQEESKEQPSSSNEVLAQIPDSLQEIKSLLTTLQQSQLDSNLKSQTPNETQKSLSNMSSQIENLEKQILKALQDNQVINNQRFFHLEQEIGKLNDHVDKNIGALTSRQDASRDLIKQSNELLGKLEEAQKQTILDAQKMAISPMQFSQFDNKSLGIESYDNYARVAQDIFDQKIDPNWVKQTAKHIVPAKYAFTVYQHQDYIFVDGTAHNIDMLKKDDFSLVGTLKTDGNPVFSMIVHGLKLFAGCAHNNLFVYEIDTQKRIQEIKSTSIIYCFAFLDYNTLMCGSRDGYLQIIQMSNLNKIQNFHLEQTSHIIQCSRTSKNNESVFATSKGLFFAEIVDYGEYKVTVNQEEIYLKNQDVKGVIEYKRDQLITCIDMDLNIFLIDRKFKQVVKQIENPSSSDRPLSMRLMAGFDIEKMPFIWLRDQEGLTLVNVKDPCAHKIFQSWYHQLPFPQMLLEVYKNMESQTVNIVVIEYTGKDSTIVKYELQNDFMGGLKHIAKSSF